MQCISCNERRDEELRYTNPAGHEQFHASLDGAKLIPTSVVQECGWDLPSSPPGAVEQAILSQYTGELKLVLNSIHEDNIQTVEGKQ